MVKVKFVSQYIYCGLSNCLSNRKLLLLYNKKYFYRTLTAAAHLIICTIVHRDIYMEKVIESHFYKLHQA